MGDQKTSLVLQAYWDPKTHHDSWVLFSNFQTRQLIHFKCNARHTTDESPSVCFCLIHTLAMYFFYMDLFDRFFHMHVI